nr:hypothetical protein [Candidatus Sigynarchaeota archaeon]
PGSIQWDVVALGKEIRIPVIKGPMNIDMLDKFMGEVLQVMETNVHLGVEEVMRLIETSKPNREQEMARYKQILDERRHLFTTVQSKTVARETATQNPENDVSIIDSLRNPARNFVVGPDRDPLVIGRDFPPVVMAEIINAAEKEKFEIDRWARYFTLQGADIIDIGASQGRHDPARLGEIVHFLVHERKLHVSIDSLDEKEILAAVDNGAEMILSIDDGNKDILDSLPKKVAIVLIPTNVKKGIFPRSTRDSLETLRSLVGFAREKGHERIVVDPILNSPIKPGIIPFLDVFIAFRGLSVDDPRLDLPLFIGGSNVSEMIDTDSTGVNAVLAVLGVELGAGILFTSEDSAKTWGSVAEMRAARDMASYARLAKNYPKDGPFSAFGCKRKHGGIQPFDIKVNATTKPVVDVSIDNYPSAFRMDDTLIYFKIFTDTFTNQIILGVFKEKEIISIFRGVSAELMGKAILKQYPGLDPTHVLYLGRELAHAEAALRHHAPYIQDEN